MDGSDILDGSDVSSINDEQNAREQVSLVEAVNDLYKRNKLNKSNVWDFDYINTFHRMIRHHHRYTRNFQRICPSLDTMTRLYELRVDSVSNDVQRLAGRVPGSPYRSESDDIVQNCSFNAIVVNDDIDNSTGRKKKRSSKKKKRNPSIPHLNIVTNKAAINAKLPLLSTIPNPIILKLQEIGGEEGKPQRMLLNIFDSFGSIHRGIFDEPFFDRKPSARIHFDPKDNYDSVESDYVELPVKLSNIENPIRQKSSGYLLEGSLNDDDLMSEFGSRMSVFNESDIFEFDMDDYHFENNDNNNNDFTPSVHNDSGMSSNQHNFHSADSDNNEAHDIIRSNLSEQRQSATEKPTHPPLENLSKGEYSYFKNIQNFAFGPSFWRMSRKRPSSNRVEAGPQPAKRRRKTKKDYEIPRFVNVDHDSDDSSDERFDKNLTSAQLIAAGRIKFKFADVTKWDPNKLLLPKVDMQIPKDYFDYYFFAPKLRAWGDSAYHGSDSDNGFEDDNSPMNSSEDECIRPDSPASPETNANNRPAFTSSPNASGFEPPPPVFNDDSQLLPIDEAISNQSNDGDIEISQHYIDAPIMVENIAVKFDKTPKLLNMHKMNEACNVSIEKQFKKSIEIRQSGMPDLSKCEKGYATYSNVHRSLVKRFPKSASPSLSLLSILHVANDERLKLDATPNESTNNFKIYKLKETDTVNASNSSLDLNGNFL